MINIEKLSHKPKVFRSLTGMDYIKFNILLEKIEPLWQKAELNRKKPDKERLRRFGGGRTPKIGLDQNLFCLLVYYRTYVSHEFIGMLASIDGTNIGRRFSGLQPILAQFFRIPERKINLTEEEILELIVDATEQETQRRDGSGYSGKKKKQSIKTQVHITPDGKIKSVSKSYAGNIHDKKVYDKTKTFTVHNRGKPKKIKKTGDLGYLGTECTTPFKSSKYHKLTKKEKQFNQKLSKKRIIIEHVFAQLKKFKILDNKFRNNLSKYNIIFKNICGLRNFITTPAASC